MWTVGGTAAEMYEIQVRARKTARSEMTRVTQDLGMDMVILFGKMRAVSPSEQNVLILIYFSGHDVVSDSRIVLELSRLFSQESRGI